MRNTNFDIIIVGGGHAGCEAAYCCGKLGSKVLLISGDWTKLAEMSCNPSIGGVGKGQIVREIDALGGMMGIISDRTRLQFRMLNRSKGPAMHSPRTQNDREEYSMAWRSVISSSENVFFLQDEVTEIIIKDGRSSGVITRFCGSVESKAVIITTGTFLDARIHVGLESEEGGRIGELASKGLAGNLAEYGIKGYRFKTGTSARIDARTIDYSQLIEQPGDEQPGRFSYRREAESNWEQLSCYLTRTNEETHDILRSGFDKSPMYREIIHGRGPRYCPSIEDKIRIFSDKDSHQLFLEPESRHNTLIYVNGLSSSLPFDVQIRAIHSIKGLENAHIMRSGYAIEYTFFNPKELKKTLESEHIEYLYLAGQVNGTTGYEEADAQGLVAGVNAHRKINGQEPFILSREESYIGVMLDDLIEKGVDEPYRMFTSRAENRLYLRQDNADQRLMRYGFELGLISEEEFEKCQQKYERISSIIGYLEDTVVALEQGNSLLEKAGGDLMRENCRAERLVKRPEIKLKELLRVIDNGEKYLQCSGEELDIAELRIKYDRYLSRSEEEIAKLQRYDTLRLRDDIQYKEMNMISYEAREKLSNILPKTIREARQINGVKASDIEALIAYIKK